MFFDQYSFFVVGCDKKLATKANDGKDVFKIESP